LEPFNGPSVLEFYQNESFLQESIPPLSGSERSENDCKRIAFHPP